MRFQFVLKIFLVCLSLFASASDLVAQPGGELKHGRYVGYIHFDERNERLALDASFYLESPELLTQFPRLNASLKTTLGGYNTHEYSNQIFQDIRYDFDSGTLTLDEPENDFTVISRVHTEGSDTIIKGQVVVRSSAVSGTIYLKWVTDEPDDSDGDEPGGDTVGDGPGSQAPFIPLLDGQYEGMCALEKAALQVQTIRGLNDSERAPTVGFDRDYRIVGRIAYDSPAFCGDGTTRPVWCSYFNFDSGVYNPYLGKLNLKGTGSSTDCQVSQGNVTCRLRYQATSVDCNFKKRDLTIKPAVFHARKFNVATTAEQRAAMPAPNPPQNAELAAALGGTFTGWLHNETTDQYQAVKLLVMPFSSTENPHNPNQMSVTTTLSAYFGPSTTSNFITQRFEPRSFYVRPGFTLNGANADSYLNVVEWRAGYIRGDYYSHAFGRVGTVQLIKGPLPPINAAAKILPSFEGEYEAPINGVPSKLRWFKVMFPAQPSDLRGSVINFTGSYQPIVGVTSTEEIERGTFDPYTGTLGWLRVQDDHATLASGQIGRDGQLKMFWPPAPNVFGVLAGNYELGPYRRTGK